MGRMVLDRKLAWVMVLAVLALPAPAQTDSNESVNEAMKAGAAQIKAGEFAKAAESYGLVTRLQPGFGEGFFNLGLAEERAGNLDAARADLEKALRLKPSLRGGNLFLGIIAYRENRFKDAETRLQAETRLDPKNAKAFMWLGICRLVQDDPKGAIAPLDRAYALDPTDVDILYHRGRAYLLVANVSYDAMYKLDHDSLRVHQVLGEAYSQAYRNEEAISEFEVAVKIAPRQPGLHEELGDQYWIGGKLDKATEAYREELRIDSRDATAMYKLGSLLVENQNPADGVPLLRDALRNDPSLNDAHYYLANGLMAIDQDQDAIREFQQAITADPANNRAMSAYYKLAQIYRKLHRTQEAQAAMQNFQRMRAVSKERRDNHAAQIARKRADLPVDDPEKSAMSAAPNSMEADELQSGATADRKEATPLNEGQKQAAAGKQE